MVLNSLSFCLSEKLLISPSYLNEILNIGLPWWLSGKEPICQCRRREFDTWVWKMPWRRKWTPLQYSCLGNPMYGGACGLQSMGSQESQTQLSK